MLSPCGSSVTPSPSAREMPCLLRLAESFAGSNSIIYVRYAYLKHWLDRPALDHEFLCLPRRRLAAPIVANFAVMRVGVMSDAEG